MRILPEFLYAIAPGASREIVDAIVASQSILVDNEIDDPTDVAFFFGFAAAETGGFTTLVENLNYTSTERLRQVWPARFKTEAAARPYVRNPKGLANLVYGGRFGNRPGTDDGWNYRGSGIGQTTFRVNFEEVEHSTGIRCVDNPELIRTMPGALEAAAIYWKNRNLSRFAQAGDYAGLTKAWQGGDGGLRDRITFTKRAADWWARYGNVTTERPQWDQRNDWLRKGNKGPAVVALQRKLQIAGYYVGGVQDGDFGDATDEAVRHFQRDNNLVADGVYGNGTARVLNAKVTDAMAAKPGGAVAPVEPGTPVDTQSQAAGLGGLLAAIIGAILALFSKGPKNGKK